MNLINFSRLFNIESGDIVFLNEEIIHPGKDHDFFYSFFKYNDSFYSLNCRYPILPYYRIGTLDFHNERIYARRYVQGAQGLEAVERVEIGRGGDPRVVSNGKAAYGIFIFVDRDKLPARDVSAVLFDFFRRRSTPITFDIPNFFFGKNWQPFLVGDDLFVVHEMTPFRVLKIDVDSGRAETVREIDFSFKLPCFHTNYAMFRGGCNAVLSSDSLFGVGRATSQRYRHHPFFWSFSEKWGVEVLLNDFFYEFHKRGYNIIDPTSLFFDKEDVYLGLCCSERDWAHKQLISHFLIRFSKERSTAGLERLSDFFARRPPVEENGVPKLDRHMFFCIEMPSATASAHEFGGRVSTGEAGHLVHGPYIRVESEGRYCAELSYLTKACPAKRAGVFDVVVSRVDGSAQDGFKTLGQIDLMRTGGEMGDARIEFDTTGLTGTSLEMRVFVEGGVELNAFHIRTWRRDGTCTAWPSVA